MSVRVPLEELRSELEDRANAAYLLTVGDGGRPHCVAVTVEWQGDDLVVAAGTTSARNAEARRQVTLLSPPAQPPLAAAGAPSDSRAGEDRSSVGGYTLIVDGDVTGMSLSGTGGVVRIRPTHGVLHRPAVAPDGGRAHDCVPVYDEASR